MTHMETSEKIFAIGLSSWIIQDGNYPDFVVGQRCRFALEFGAREPLAAVDASRPVKTGYHHIGGGFYSVVAQIVHNTPKWWAVDFGLKAYCNHRIPIKISKASYVKGVIYIGIDPFFYFESRSKERDAPALIYEWVVNGIQIETAPFIEVAPRSLVRDMSKSALKEIARTDAWKDDEGHGSYLLYCKLLDVPPSKHLKKDKSE